MHTAYFNPFQRRKDLENDTPVAEPVATGRYLTFALRRPLTYSRLEAKKRALEH